MNYKYFQCPKCKNVRPAGEWNMKTLLLCTSRELVRTFKKIQHSVGQNRWYVCPACSQNSAIKEILPVLKTDIKEAIKDETNPI